MTYKRFFSFGCSFTQYYWPTWADIIAENLDIEFHNFGVCGIGNVGIMHQLLIADLKYNLNKDDLIIVGWTYWNREDRYNNNRWLAVGNIFNNHYYDKNFIKKYWFADNDIVKNYTAIILANRSFDITYQFHIDDYHSLIDEYENEINDTIEQFSMYEKMMPKKNIFENKYNLQFQNCITDHHPDILCHQQHSEKILSTLGLNISDKTKDKIQKEYTYVCNLIREKYKKLQTYDQVETVFKNIYGKKFGESL